MSTQYGMRWRLRHTVRYIFLCEIGTPGSKVSVTLLSAAYAGETCFFFVPFFSGLAPKYFNIYPLLHWKMFTHLVL